MKVDLDNKVHVWMNMCNTYCKTDNTHTQEWIYRRATETESRDFIETFASLKSRKSQIFFSYYKKWQPQKQLL
jgi:hypothetical protein